jgi:hypothetical protein
MQTQSPSTTLSISNNQLQVLAIYSHYQAEYKTISREKLHYNAIIILSMRSRFISQQSYVKLYNTRQNEEVSEFCKII